MSSAERVGRWAIVDEPWGFRVVLGPAWWTGLLALLGAATLATLGLAFPLEHERAVGAALCLFGGVACLVGAIHAVRTRTFMSIVQDPRAASAPRRRAVGAESIAAVRAINQDFDNWTLVVMTPCEAKASPPARADPTRIAAAIRARLSGCGPTLEGRRWTLVTDRAGNRTVHVHGHRPFVALALCLATASMSFTILRGLLDEIDPPLGVIHWLLAMVVVYGTGVLVGSSISFALAPMARLRVTGPRLGWRPPRRLRTRNVQRLHEFHPCPSGLGFWGLRARRAGRWLPSWIDLDLDHDDARLLADTLNALRDGERGSAAA